MRWIAALVILSLSGCAATGVTKRLTPDEIAAIIRAAKEGGAGEGEYGVTGSVSAYGGSASYTETFSWEHDAGN